MGGHAWFYFVDYEPDIDSALQKLREREFRAGRYNPVTWFPEFPVGPDSPAPGAQHASIDEALEEADADGTRSILDMMRIADEPDYFACTPMPQEDLIEFFGTDKPTHEMIKANNELFDALERGQGVYVVVYKDDEPSEIFFAGYSFD